MNVLVTGGAGFIGSHVVVHLAAAVGVGQSMYAPHYYTSVNVDGQGVLMEAMAAEPGDIRHCIGDPAHTEAALGFAARMSFERGLDELIAWASAEAAEDHADASMAELERQRLVR
jgi:nucleoside-diphosphate-sugar epimerase